MKFRKKEHIEFDDSMDPDDANEQIHSVQRILEFIELKDRDKVLEYVRLIEVRCQLLQNKVSDWMVVPSIMWDESLTGFLNLKQKMMMMIKVVRKFKKPERLCTFVKLCKEEKVQ